MKLLSTVASLLLFSWAAHAMEAGEGDLVDGDDADAAAVAVNPASAQSKIMQILAQHPEINKPEFALFEQFEYCMQELLLNIEEQ